MPLILPKIVVVLSTTIRVGFRLDHCLVWLGFSCFVQLESKLNTEIGFKQVAEIKHDRK